MTLPLVVSDEMKRMSASCCLWATTKGYVVAGPTHDIRDIYPGARRITTQEQVEALQAKYGSRK